eukprot:RCo005881
MCQSFAQRSGGRLPGPVDRPSSRASSLVTCGSTELSDRSVRIESNFTMRPAHRIQFTIDCVSLMEAVMTASGPYFPTNQGIPVLTLVPPSASLELLTNWMASVDRLDVGFVCICLWRRACHALRRRKVPTVALEASHPRALRFVRAIVWRLLLALGVSFISSEFTSVWVKNPVPIFFALTNHSVALAQGTTSPPALLKRWGFVASDALVFARPTNFSEKFLMLYHRVLATQRWVTLCDALNVALCQPPPLGSVRWVLPRGRPRSLYHQGLILKGYDQEIVGHFHSLNGTLAILPHLHFPAVAMRVNPTDRIVLPRVVHVLRHLLSAEELRAGHSGGSVA